MKKIFLVILMSAGTLSSFAQRATFRYEYHPSVAKAGAFTFYDSDDKIIFHASASAGHLGAANNPYFQLTKDKGPLPNGTWEIYAVKNKDLAILRLRPTSDVAMPLDKDGKPFRDGFLIHGVGDNKTPSESSTGCIILAPQYRKTLLAAFEKKGPLKVVVTNIVGEDKIIARQ